MKRACPNCYEKWARREAKPAAVKILHNRGGRRIVHGVVSFEADMAKILEFRKVVYDILKLHGILQGVLIPHHERHGAYDGYLHYHFLGYLGINNRYLPGQQGWYIFKVIRWLDRAGDIENTIKYFLTHCAIVNGRHAITYFGPKFKKPPMEQKSLDEWCPLCQMFTARTVPIIDRNGGYLVTVHSGCIDRGCG